MNEAHTTSLALSQQLKALGIPQVSEFYWVITFTTEYHLSWYPDGLPDALKKRNDCYSAFLASELGEILPAYLKDGRILTITKNQYNEFWIQYALDSQPIDEKEQLSHILKSAMSMPEAMGKMLEYLKKEGLI